MEQITDLGGLCWDVYAYVQDRTFVYAQAGEVSIQYMECTLASRKWVTLCFKFFFFLRKRIFGGC